MDFHRRRKLAAPVHPFPFHRAMAFYTFLLAPSDFFNPLKTTLCGFSRTAEYLHGLNLGFLCRDFILRYKTVADANLYTADLKLEKLRLILICIDNSKVSL